MEIQEQGGIYLILFTVEAEKTLRRERDLIIGIIHMIRLTTRALGPASHGLELLATEF